MSLAITAFLVLAIISLLGTLIATELSSMVDSDDAPEAMTGDDYQKASEAADR